MPVTFAKALAWEIVRVKEEGDPGINSKFSIPDSVEDVMSLVPYTFKVSSPKPPVYDDPSTLSKLRTAITSTPAPVSTVSLPPPTST